MYSCKVCNLSDVHIQLLGYSLSFAMNQVPTDRSVVGFSFLSFVLATAIRTLLPAKATKAKTAQAKKADKAKKAKAKKADKAQARSKAREEEAEI